jgi:FHA domain-containing protein
LNYARSLSARHASKSPLHAWQVKTTYAALTNQGRKEIHMLKLEVINYKGITPQRPISAEFDKVGGSIGRGDVNALILPDADRYISRMHARISYRSGRYFIEDHGTATPVIVNGRTLGKGIDAPLENGNEIKIGDYRLRATVQDAVSVASATMPGAGAVDSSAKAVDPMAMFGASSAADPFADLIPSPKPGARMPDVPSASPAGLGQPIPDPFAPAQSMHAKSAIPADFDPFGNIANLGQPATASPGKGVTAGTLSGAPDGAFGTLPESQSIDALFGLNPASANDPLGETRKMHAVTASIPMDLAPSLDPMAQFQPKPVVQAANSQRNNVPEVNASFVPPRVLPDPPVTKPAIPPVQHEPPAAKAASATMFDTPQRAEPSSEPPAPSPVTPQPQADPLLETKRFKREDVAQEATVRAFLDGAGIADLDLPAGLTPQTMFMLGQVLRETVQAMLDLLLARAMLKRELRADVTMILAKENNPLKFSPNVEAALTHLLNPQRGYKQPLEAVKDACNDLRSHQFAFMSGMRAALEGILHRFDPAQLEQRLKQKTVLDSVLPINRKAKLWDQFSELYGDMSKEAEEDFHALFGREFVRAYEAQIEKLTRQDAAAKGS